MLKDRMNFGTIHGSFPPTSHPGNLAEITQIPSLLSITTAVTWGCVAVSRLGSSMTSSRCLCFHPFHTNSFQCSGWSGSWISKSKHLTPLLKLCSDSVSPRTRIPYNGTQGPSLGVGGLGSGAALLSPLPSLWQSLRGSPTGLLAS